MFLHIYDNIALKCHSNFLFLPLKNHNHRHQSTRPLGNETTEPLIVILLLTNNYPVPINVKEICVSPFCLLSNLRDFPALLSPTSLIYHEWISCNPLKPPSLILMHEISCKMAIFWSTFLNPLIFCFSAIVNSLAQINS